MGFQVQKLYYKWMEQLKNGESSRCEWQLVQKINMPIAETFF